MVKKLSIGILGIQGAISEHKNLMEKVLKETDTTGEIILVNQKKEISKLTALIIPGGESSTISRILDTSNIYFAIKKRIKEEDFPIMGTCAGCVILAKELEEKSKKVKLLNAMDIKVERNAFGRQKESFEKIIDINGFSKPYNAVFIRAPIIKKTWGKCEILAKMDNIIVMAKQDNILAISFHPELTNDIRIHKYFLDIIQK
jgi:5'-phosphate synthase pdxT subunit